MSSTEASADQRLQTLDLITRAGSAGTAPLVVTRQALVRLATALVAQDDFDGDLTLEAAVERLSDLDCRLLVGVVARIAILEVRDGAVAAQFALERVLTILRDGRAGA